jgi:RNA polymerase sigma-70 factor (ECF subfamily)
LAAASGKGDPAAFGELVSRHQDRAFNLAFRLTGSHEDAADAVQEAFLKAYRGMRSFRRQSSFYTWLFRIVVNEVRSRRRSGSSRHPVFSLDAADSRSAGDPADAQAGLRADGPDPSEQASLTERRRIVEEALQSLDFDQRAIIALRDIEGRDYAEIAELLGCPQGTVKSRLHRARMALKDALAPKLGPTPQ